MAKIIRSGDPTSILYQTSQAGVKEQMAALVDAVRAMAGNSNFMLSPTLEADLLNTKYVLYVNSDIGSDDVVFGNYNSDRQQLNQELECGYSPFRPFKTLARAYAEVARRSILAGSSNDIYNRAVIFVAPSDAVIYNNVGSAVGSVSPWAEGAVSSGQLNALNDATNPGLIHPRGISVFGMSYRNVVFRPSFVPSGTSSAVTGRTPIFRATGGSHFSNFTIQDNTSITTTHHLVHAHEYVDQADLIEYYQKIMTVFGLTGAEVVNPGETEIVAPTPDGIATSSVDSTKSASLYAFNLALRSDYGMSGVFLDGRDVTGFRSMEVAQYTIISLQKDYANAYQRYQGGTWVNVADFNDYLSANVNDLRLRIGGTFDWTTSTYSTDYRHFGFKLAGNAFIQGVSEFTIGQGIHHWIASGSSADLTGANSFAGGTALFAHGFAGVGDPGGSLQQDRGFLGIGLKRPLKIPQDGSNIRRLTLGQVSASNGYVVSGSTAYIDLAAPLTEDTFTALGISLTENHYIWIKNSSRDVGPGSLTGDPATNTAVDVRAQLAATPWDPATPSRIYVKTGANNNILSDGMTIGELALNEVYVRRLIDTRSASEREYSMIVSNSDLNRRQPQGGFVIRLGNRGVTSAQLDPTNGADQVFVIDTSSATTVTSPVADTNYFSLIIRPADSVGIHSASSWYLPSTPVSHQGRIYRANKRISPKAFNPGDWVVANRDLPDVRGISHPRSNIAPRIIIDKDLSNNPNSLTLDVDLNADADVIGQLTAATDYIAVQKFLAAIGYASTSSILLPQATEALRIFDPSATTSPTPNGKLTLRQAWPLEFNSPSIIESSTTIFRYIGRHTYAKGALPRYAVTTLTDQNRIDAARTACAGGVVYADGSIENGLRLAGDQLTDLANNRDVSVESAGIGGLSDPGSLETDTNSEPDAFTFQDDLLVQGALTVQGIANLDGGISSSSRALAKASNTAYGFTRPATSTEAADGIRGISSIDFPAVYVQPQQLKTVLDTISLLPDTQTILYVDGGATIGVDGLATYSSIQAQVWTDIKANISVHGLTTWTDVAPSQGSTQSAFARAIVFNNVKQAFDFINSRNPTSRSRITIYLYNSSYSNTSSSTAGCVYNGRAELAIEIGPSATVQSGGFYWSQVHCCGVIIAPYTAKLILNRVQLNFAGTQANLATRSTSSTTAVNASFAYLSNVSLTWRTTSPVGSGVIVASYLTGGRIEVYADRDNATGHDITLLLDVQDVDNQSVSLYPAPIFLAHDIVIWTRRDPIAPNPAGTFVPLNMRVNHRYFLNGTGQQTRDSWLFETRNTFFCVLSGGFPAGSNASSGGISLTIDLTGSNLTGSLYFLRPGTDTSTCTIRISDWDRGAGLNSKQVTIPSPDSSRGTYGSFFGVGTSSSLSELPVTLLGGTRNGDGTNNTTNLFSLLENAFKVRGMSDANAYSWRLPAGSWRDGRIESLTNFDTV